MPRVITIPAPEPEKPQLETWTLTLKTITPMFGGSATVREVDTENPVRAASVRGHLRFWWRATAGARYASSEQLFKAEEEIWGSAEKQGLVALCVSQQSYENTLQPSSLGEKVKPIERFFVHPFLRTKTDLEASGLTGVSFTLGVRLSGSLSSEQKNQVRQAVRAWLTFGGVGARTRRGLGALKVTSENAGHWHPKDIREIATWFSGSNHSLTHSSLSGAVAAFSNKTDPKQAWRKLSLFWARFRKGHYTGKYKEYSAMGGAMWQDHSKLKAIRPGDTAVRLVKPYLGMPIIYQKFYNSFAGKVAPVGEKQSRMASPVILKPVVFADASVQPVVLVLNTPKPTRVDIKGEEYDLAWPSDDRVVRALNAAGFCDTILQAASKDGFNEKVEL